MINLNNLMYGENYPIINIMANEEKIELYVESKTTTCNCPECGFICNNIHDTHFRYIQDTPIHNKQVWLNLTVNEFKCTNEKCKNKTFTEEIPFVGKIRL